MKISIVMASYNYAPIIGEAIESVINQTYKDWELIIVDDGSADNSVEVIKKYLSDNRIKLYINEKNLGLAKTVRKGIQYSTSDWIAFLESDDKFSPNALEEKVFGCIQEKLRVTLSWFTQDEKSKRYIICRTLK